MDYNHKQMQKPSSQHIHKTSPGDLFSSAQVLAGAAQSTIRHQAINKPKVADAADNLLNAASKYGKLEEKGYGHYVNKADNYLHQYNSGSGPSSAQGMAKSKGGFGYYRKIAQGFFKK